MAGGSGMMGRSEAHIREASDVIAQGLVFSVPYPLEIVLVSRLLAGGDEVVDECLPQFFS